MNTSLKQGLVVLLAVSGAFAVSNTAGANESVNSYSSKQVSVSDGATVVASFTVSRGTKRASRSRVMFSTTREDLNYRELKELLYKVGFRGQNLKEAWCIAMRESHGRPMAHNQNTSTGDNSYGIFQINMLGYLGVDRRDRFNLESNSNLFNPLKNAEIAFYMSNGGENWTAWHGLNEDARKWFDNYPV
jgi:hypothetical protein